MGQVGTRTLIFRLGKPLAAVPEPLQDYGPRLDEDGTLLQLTLPRDCPGGEVLAAACSLGLDIVDLETQATGLEEAFLELTGRKLGNGRTA